MKKPLLALLLVVALPAAAQTVTGTAQTWMNPSSGSSNGTLSSPSTGVPGSVSGYVPLEPLTVFNGGKFSSFADYLSTVYKLAITIGALIAVILLISGGVRYMWSDGATSIWESKLRIRGALFGLLILVGSFLILYTINPNLLNFTALTQSLTPVTQKPSNFTSVQNTYSNIQLDQARANLQTTLDNINNSTPDQLRQQYNATKCATIRTDAITIANARNAIRMNINARQAQQEPYLSQLTSLDVQARQNTYEQDQCQAAGN